MLMVTILGNNSMYQSSLTFLLFRAIMRMIKGRVTFPTKYFLEVK
jgi:hypothetical protein